jgi:hypothetical protein
MVLLACLVSCKNKIDPRVLTLPEFKIQLFDGTQILPVAKGKPTILVYFDPGCKFSRLQTETIIRNYRSLQHIQFYMFSPYPLQQLHDFYRHYHLENYDNITMGRDYDGFFEKELKVPSFPWLFIYAPGKELKKIITGNVDVQTILNNING